MNAYQEGTQSNNHIFLNIPARFENLVLIESCLHIIFNDLVLLTSKETIQYNIQLAAYEICTNIINHAYEALQGKDNRIGIELFWDQSKVEIHFEDNGTSFDMPEPSSIKAPPEPSDHGYGLFLIFSLVDKIKYLPLKDKNHWVLIKNLL